MNGRTTRPSYSKCTKKCYSESSVNREIARLKDLARRQGRTIEREPVFCPYCNAHHITYPEMKGPYPRQREVVTNPA